MAFDLADTKAGAVWLRQRGVVGNECRPAHDPTTPRPHDPTTIQSYDHTIPIPSHTSHPVPCYASPPPPPPPCCFCALPFRMAIVMLRMFASKTASLSAAWAVMSFCADSVAS